MSSDAEPDTTYEQSQREARRAQWALNILVGMSALAGAVFFAYVIYTVRPFSKSTPDPIDVPVSAAGPRVGMLTAEDEAGLSVTLRDIDDAPTYREQLSERIRQDLGIQVPGRLYTLIVTAGEAAEFRAPRMSLTGPEGQRWQVLWLHEVASAEDASGAARLRLSQSAHEFSLGKGERRQLYVFVEGNPPSAEDFKEGVLELAGGRRVALTHIEVRVATR